MTLPDDRDNDGQRQAGKKNSARRPSGLERCCRTPRLERATQPNRSHAAENEQHGVPERKQKQSVIQ